MHKIWSGIIITVSSNTSTLTPTKNCEFNAKIDKTRLFWGFYVFSTNTFLNFIPLLTYAYSCGYFHWQITNFIENRHNYAVFRCWCFNVDIQNRELCTFVFFFITTVLQLFRTYVFIENGRTPEERQSLWIVILVGIWWLAMNFYWKKNAIFAFLMYKKYIFQRFRRF